MDNLTKICNEGNCIEVFDILPKGFIIKNVVGKEHPIEEIINHYWVPIRKQYRLLYNVDVIMCYKDCIVEEENRFTADGRKIRLPGVSFSTVCSFVYNEHSLKDDEFVYQKISRREKIRGDIRSFQYDPKKVRMQYVSKEIYEEFVKRNKSNSINQQRVYSVLIRKMKKPTEEQISNYRQSAISEFLEKINKYIEAYWSEKTKNKDKEHIRLEMPEVIIL